MLNINQSNIPQQLSMNDFKTAADSAGQFAKGCRFVVRINTPPELNVTIPDGLHLMCEAVEFPGRGFNVTETRYYGPSMSFPNNTVYGAGINMQFICRTNSPERYFFDEWMEFINPTSSFNFAYPNHYWAEIEVFQLSEFAAESATSFGKYKDPTQNLNQLATYAWTIRKAWPTLVTPQQVTWSDQDILRLQVNFAYKYWDRPLIKK